jgi:DNA-binding transcriptional LysR family regulator
VAAWQGKAAGRVVIGAMPLSRARWLPETLLRFTGAHPGVDVAVVEGSHAELVGPLRDGEIDFMLGALRDTAMLDDLVQEAAFEDRPALVMRAGHPLADAGVPLDPAALRHYPWILPGGDTPLRHYWEAMMQRHRPRPAACGHRVWFGADRAAIAGGVRCAHPAQPGATGGGTRCRPAGFAPRRCRCDARSG